jgi:hypothetical protein
MKPITLKFKQVNKIFPAGYTKLKMPFGTHRLMEEKGKHMELKEIQSILEFERKWNKQLNNNTACFEYYAKRGKQSIKLIPFEE